MMKPGDLIEWCYKECKQPVDLKEKLWSEVMKRWVPVGKVSILLYMNDKTYGWMNNKGCFSARMIDSIPLNLRHTHAYILPCIYNAKL